MAKGSSQPAKPQPVVQTTSVQPTGTAADITKQAQKIGASLIAKPPKIPDPVPFTPLQTEAQQGYVTAAKGPVQSLVGQTTGAESTLLDPSLLYAESNPYLQSYIDATLRPITENYTTSVLPNIRSGTIANTGTLGSRAGIAEGLATSDYLRSLGDTTAKITEPAYEAGITNLGKAVSAAPTVAGFNLLPSSILDVVGNEQQQQQLQQQYVDFANKYMPFLTAQDVASFATGLPGATKGVSSVQGAAQTQPPSTGQSILGGAAGGASLGSIIGSAVPGVGTLAGSVIGALLGGGATAFA